MAIKFRASIRNRDRRAPGRPLGWPPLDLDHPPRPHPQADGRGGLVRENVRQPTT